MQKKTAQISEKPFHLEIEGQVGMCGMQEVFLGFANGSVLSRISFSDVLDEATRTGYQRRFCKEHSLSFKRYIQSAGATTIPLTFNLRGDRSDLWSLEREQNSSRAVLKLSVTSLPVMAQVDCQHRLGYLRESTIPFAFMTFISLPVEEEMRIFRDINGKAKGLSGSLLDYTGAKLAQKDLAVAHPSISLALRLQEDSDSPWQHKLDLGGDRTSGTKRVASLRMMEKAIRRFQKAARAERDDVEQLGKQLIDFWKAVAVVYPNEWAHPRKHLLTKGIGVYALMSIAGVLVHEAKESKRVVDQDFFIEKLSDFADSINWSNDGEMKGFGGASGADRAFELMQSAREKAHGDTYGKQEHPFGRTRLQKQIPPTGADEASGIPWPVRKAG